MNEIDWFLNVREILKLSGRITSQLWVGINMMSGYPMTIANGSLWIAFPVANPYWERTMDESHEPPPGSIPWATAVKPGWHPPPQPFSMKYLVGLERTLVRTKFLSGLCIIYWSSVGRFTASHPIHQTFHHLFYYLRNICCGKLYNKEKKKEHTILK